MKQSASISRRRSYDYHFVKIRSSPSDMKDAVYLSISIICDRRNEMRMRGRRGLRVGSHKKKGIKCADSTLILAVGVARCAIDVDVDRRQTAFDYGKVAALKTLNAKRD